MAISKLASAFNVLKNGRDSKDDVCVSLTDLFKQLLPDDRLSLVVYGFAGTGKSHLIQQVEFNGQVFFHLPKKFTAKPLPLLLQHKFTLHEATYYLESISCWVNQNHFTCVQYIHAGTSGFRTGWYAYDGMKDYTNRELRKLCPFVCDESEELSKEYKEGHG
jgi:hypothetical protein